MLGIKKILLPVDFPNTSLGVIHQAAALARHFRSEIVMLHILTPRSHAAGIPEDGAGLARWNLLEEIVKRAQENKGQALGPELNGLTIRRVLATGNLAQAILQTAEREKADLIMLPTYGFTFDHFLMGSVTSKVPDGRECPLWTCGHAEELPAQNFAIRNVLCAVNFRSNARKTVLFAMKIAAEFGASLTLADVTTGVESWGPGGNCVNSKWKAALVSDATRHIADIQQDLGIKADVFIGSGDVPLALNQAAKQANANLLVIGCRPYGVSLRTQAYSIIRSTQIPVLSVGGC
jgi:nucleotide-binding universal stress UspA family protein